MKNKLLLLAGTVLALTLGSCLNSFDEVRNPPDGTDSYTISGTVKLSDQNNDVPTGTLITLKQGEMNVKFGMVFDDEGNYTLEGVTPGKYSMKISLDGYETGVIPEFKVSRNVDKDAITLNKIYTVSGTISTCDGASAKGAYIQLRRADGSPAGGVTSADANGAYTIGGVTGTYTIEVSLLGYTTYTMDISVPKANISGKNIILQKTATPYTVSGTILTSDGAGAQGAYVRLRSWDGWPVGDLIAADNSGAYRIPNVYAGTYTIEASLDGYTNTIGFSVSNASLTDIDITLDRNPTPYTVSGTLRTSDGAGAQGAYVRLRSSGGWPVGDSIAVNADGSYSISGVSPGTYTIEASLYGYTASPTSITVSNASLTAPDITLYKNTQTMTYTVSGTISTWNGSSVQGLLGASIQLRKDGSPVGGITASNADGTYSISGVSPGTYTIEVSLGGYTTYTMSITISNADITAKNITLSKITSHMVSGTISTSDRGSAQGAYVLLRQNGALVGGIIAADAHGAYSIPIDKAGDYAIEVSLPGYTTYTMSITVSSALKDKNITLQRND